MSSQECLTTKDKFLSEEFLCHSRPLPRKEYLSERKIFLLEHQSKERLLRGQKVIKAGHQGNVTRSLTSSKTITEDKRGNMLKSCTCGPGSLKRNEELFVNINTRSSYECVFLILRPWSFFLFCLYFLN